MTPTRPRKETKPRKNLGGRPRNNWTRSRIRRACRLYAFTPLKMEHIVKVLELPGFSPGKRDVEKNIFKVFPKIQKKWTTRDREFAGWKEIQRCAHDRRTRRALRSTLEVKKTENSHTVSNSMSILSEENSLAGVSETTNLNVTSNEASKSCDDSGPSAVPQPEPATQRYKNDKEVQDSFSQLSFQESINATSSFASRVVSVCRSSGSGVSSHFSWAANISPRNPTRAKEKSLLPGLHQPKRDFCKTYDHTCSTGFRDFQPTKTPLQPTIQSEEFGASPNFSLEEQLTWDAFIEEENFAPSLLFLHSCVCCHNSQALEATSICFTCGSSWLQRCCYLSSRANTLSVDQKYQIRECREHRDYYNNSALHYAAGPESVDFLGITSLVVDQGFDANVKNTAGATFMHIMNWGYVWTLLYHPDYEKFEDFTNMIRALSWSFNIHERDYFGRTIAHEAFTSEKAFNRANEDISQIEKMLQILEPDITARDIFGRSVGDIVRSWANDLRSDGVPQRADELEHVLMTYQATRTYKKPLNDCYREVYHRFCLHFGRDLSNPLRKSLTNWIKTDEHINRIDDGHETPLLALLMVGRSFHCKQGWNKQIDHCVREEALELISLGAEIHQRDLHGNTALLLATCLGDEEVVSLLLEKGANPNIFSYNTSSIFADFQSLLSQAERSMARAKQSIDLILSASILFCIHLVTKAGAVAKPEPKQIWGSEEYRKKLRDIR